MRETVQFERATRALLDGDRRTFIEVSPHPVLTIAVEETVEDASADEGCRGARGTGGALDRADVGVLGSLRRGEGGRRRFLTSLGEAWVRGVDVDWEAVLDAPRPRSLWPRAMGGCSRVASRCAHIPGSPSTR
jgi:acyl transferase domain-containing protein